MKKLFLLAGASCICMISFGQTPVQFGIKAGPNFSSYTGKTEGTKTTSKLITGLAGGVFANIPLAPEFYLQTSLLYEGKGGKDKTSDATLRLNYVTLPIDFLFSPQVGMGMWQVGVGPYFGYGLSGKFKDDSGLTDNTDPFKGDDAFLKRFDAGLNVQIGYQFSNGFGVNLNSELGLSNLAKNGNSDNSFRNTSFGVSLAYAFGSR